MVFAANLWVGTSFGTAFVGGVYAQLDDERPSMVTFALSERGQFSSIRYFDLKPGPHRLAFGLIDAGGTFVAVGQRCFVTRDLLAEEYDVSNPPR